MQAWLEAAVVATAIDAPTPAARGPRQHLRQVRGEALVVQVGVGVEICRGCHHLAPVRRTGVVAAVAVNVTRFCEPGLPMVRL